MAKVFKITQSTDRGRVYTQEGTLSELISAYRLHIIMWKIIWVWKREQKN